MDEFRDIPGFPGYKINENGRILSCRSPRGHLRDKWVELRPFTSDNVYPRVCLRDGKTSKKKYVHQLVLEAFVGPRPQGTEVCHNDGDRMNFRLSNLRYGTMSENQADRVKHGTSNRGSRQGSSVLTEADVLGIFRDRKAGMTLKAIAKKNGVSRSAIQAILERRNWGWLEIPDDLRPTIKKNKRRVAHA